MYLAERRRDKLGDDVLYILRGLTDLVAEEAMYHKKCYTTLYNLPQSSQKTVSLNGILIPYYISKTVAYISN